MGRRGMLLRRCGVIAAGLTLATTVQAQSWYAVLSGAAESPPNASPATGFATFTLIGSMFTINASFSGLTGTTTAAHIHCCTAAPFTSTVGVASETPSYSLFPLGVTSGTFFNTFDLLAAGSWNPAFITANGGSPASARDVLINGMNTGTSYFNIHTQTFSGGEIRGFIVVTPEPATWLLMVAGLTTLGVLARRRKRGVDATRLA